MTEDNLLEVGDVIVITTATGKSRHRIKRVNAHSVSLENCPLLLDKKAYYSKGGLYTMLREKRRDPYASYLVIPKKKP